MSHGPSPHPSQLALAAPMDLGVGVLDQLRRAFWALAVRLGIGNRFIGDRSARITLLAALAMLAALTISVMAPLWLLLLGPLLIGVPHVLSDVRYLLLRPPKRLAPGAAVAILLPLAGMTTLRLVLLAGGPRYPTLEIGLGLAALTNALLRAEGSALRRVALLALVAAVGVPALWRPNLAALVLGHAHNLIAFSVWLAWSRSDGPLGRYLAVGALYVACIAALGSGLLEPLSMAAGAFNAPATGLSFYALTWQLAPGLEPRLAARLVLIFAFAQSVHYSVWLRLVPAAETFCPRPGPTTFRRNVLGLERDFGRWGFQLALLLCLALPAAMLIARPATLRAVYLTLVLFHGWLELAVFAHLFAQPRDAGLPEQASAADDASGEATAR
jgi:hypothetical protein